MSDGLKSKNEGGRTSPARTVAYVALGVAFICACSYLALPFAVPITMQTLAIYLLICVLGEKKATFSIFIYLLAGAIGLPVFSSFTGGVGVLLGPLGGYLVSFLAMPAVNYAVCRARGRSTFSLAVGLSLGTLLCYALGSAWFAFVNGAEGGLLSALATCVAPFILPDAIKIAIALFVYKRVAFLNLNRI